MITSFYKLNKAFVSPDASSLPPPAFLQITSVAGPTPPSSFPGILRMHPQLSEKVVQLASSVATLQGSDTTSDSNALFPPAPSYDVIRRMHPEFAVSRAWQLAQSLRDNLEPSLSDIITAESTASICSSPDTTNLHRSLGNFFSEWALTQYMFFFLFSLITGECNASSSISTFIELYGSTYFEITSRMQSVFMKVVQSGCSYDVIFVAMYHVATLFPGGIIQSNHFHGEDAGMLLWNVFALGMALASKAPCPGVYMSDIFWKQALILASHSYKPIDFSCNSSGWVAWLMHLHSHAMSNHMLRGRRIHYLFAAANVLKHMVEKATAFPPSFQMVTPKACRNSAATYALRLHFLKDFRLRPRVTALVVLTDLVRKIEGDSKVKTHPSCYPRI